VKYARPWACAASGGAPEISDDAPDEDRLPVSSGSRAAAGSNRF